MTVSFPASYELILRKNKSEIEDLLKKRLLAYRPHTVPGMLSPEYPDSTGQKNFFIDTKGYYLLESLRADHYYIKNRQGYSLVVNKQNPPETVANLMTTGEISNRLNLTIVQKKYGFRQDTFRIPLNHWTLFCREEGCTPYFGIEEYDGKKITASLIMDNPSLGYICCISPFRLNYWINSKVRFMPHSTPISRRTIWKTCLTTILLFPEGDLFYSIYLFFR